MIRKVSIPHLFYSISLFLLFAFTFLVISCKSDLTDFGSGIIPGQDNLPLDCDSVTIVSSDVVASKALIVQNVNFIHKRYDALIDSILYSSYGSAVLGEYKDEAFGSTSSSILFQLSPAGYYATGKSKIISGSTCVSLILKIAKKDTAVIIGSRSDIQNYQIFSLTDTIPKPADSVFYANTNYETYKDRVLAGGTYQPSDNKYSLKFEITDQMLKDNLLNLDSLKMTNLRVFNQNVLKGFFITSNTTSTSQGGAISVLDFNNSDSTYMEMTYINPGDTTKYKYRFYISLYPTVISSFKREAVNFDLTKYNYLEGLDSKNIEVKLENLERFRRLGPMSIQKAVLILTPDSIPDGKPYHNFPKLIGINVRGATEATDVLIDDEQPSIFKSYTYFGGFYNNHVYKFNITRYIQNFVKNPSQENLSLILKVRNSFYDGYFDAGRLAFKKNNSIKLKVYYTKLK